MTGNWTQRYVDHVLRETGLTLSGLASKAGVSSTTLTRWKNSVDHPYDLSRGTLDKIRKATGISFSGFAPGVEEAEASVTSQDELTDDQLEAIARQLWNAAPMEDRQKTLEYMAFLRSQREARERQDAENS